MAKRWEIIDRVESPDGLLELRKRDEGDFLICIDGRVLMNSLANRSECVLSELACAAIGKRKSPRVLIGGLGMGCTLKAALDALPAAASIKVAELNEVILGWCKGPLASLTDSAVTDPRVSVDIEDVSLVIMKAAVGEDAGRFDAIILDLYEGPFESDGGKGEAFYGDSALKLTHTALAPGGVFAVWSEDPDKSFERRLKNAGFSFEKQKPGRGGLRHIVYIARPIERSKTSRSGGKGRSSGRGRS